MTAFEYHKLLLKQQKEGLNNDELIQLNPTLSNNKAFVSNELLTALFHRGGTFTALQLLIFIASRDEANTQKIGEYYKIRFNLDEFQSIHGTNPITLYKHLDHIQKTIITFYGSDGEWQDKISLIARQTKITRKIIEVDMHQKIYTMIKQKEGNFSVLNALDFRNKVSYNTIRVLFLINLINNQTIKRKFYALDELNFMFDTSYKKIYDFEKGILRKAQIELDENNSYLTYKILKKDDTQDIKKGRPKTVGIYIEVIDRKKEQQTNEEIKYQQYIEQKKEIYREHEQQGTLGIV